MTTATSPAREADPTSSATLALAVLTVAAALGMGRLFDSRDFLAPFLLAAATGHWLAWLARRYDISLPVALPLSLAGVLVVAAWTLFPDTTAYGIPWSATFKAVTEACRAAWNDFATVVAPAPPSKGFLFAGTVGIGMAALLADWAAFRVRAVFEAAIPSFTLFVFTAVLGAAHYRGWSVAAYLAALFLFLLVHQAGMATESASWFASRAKGGMGALLQGGALLGTVAIVAALVLGPNLPGSDADPVIAWRDNDRSGPSKRTTVSPLVDIRGRLVEQSNLELFTVRADQPSYWRLTSLDTFDGSIWQSEDNYRGVDEGLPRGVPVTAEKATLTQDYTITALSSIWLPAAYRPTRIEGLGSVSFNEDSASLITNTPSTDGYSYRVVSELPRPTADQLDAAPPLTGSRLNRYLELPSIPGRVQRLANDLTRNQASAYDKAKAMQDWFHANFTYDLKARAGHDGRALERFLFESKRGYCEQFAGAFAVMARAVGLPARVAVGFTPGEVDAEGRYHVRGLNAHAWPEVYIQGYGWVYFEATPDRGMPGAGWTQVPPQQALVTNPAQSAPITTTTVATPESPDNPTPATTPEEDGSVSTAPEDPEPSALGNRLVQLLLAVVVAAVAALIGMPVAKRARRGRRRADAGDVSRRVLVAWTEAEEALASAGAPRRPSETIDEYAVRAPRVAALPAPATEALHELARHTTVASYAPATPTAETVQRATASAATIERALHEQSTVRQRVWRGIDPRPLLPTNELRATRASLRSRVRERLGR